MRKRLLIFSMAAICIALFSFKNYFKGSAMSADKIFIKGKVLTMDDANSIREAVAVKDGKIMAVGTTAEMLKLKGSETSVIDLGGKTIIPGMIDGHSHFMAMEITSGANIFSAPAGNMKNIPDIIKEVEKFQKLYPVNKGEWIMAFGYDPDQLQEKRHPTKEDLDKAFPDIPVMLTHASGHMSVVNSAALRVSGVTNATPDPSGGQIVRDSVTKEATGLLLEHGREVLKVTAHKKTDAEQFDGIKRQQEYYASMGITTAQDGFSNLPAIELLKKAADKHLLYIDIEALPGFTILDTLLKQSAEYKFNVLTNHLKLAGCKLAADGSPQGKTAYMSKPYLTPVPGCSDACTGIPTVTEKVLNETLLKEFRNNIQSYVHCNGDAAIDMYIEAVEKTDSLLHTSSMNRRPVIIHSQFVRPDQLDSYKRLGMVPAFFTNHAFFWGDTHLENLGMQRASFLSPLKSAINKKIIFTNHTDFPVTPVNQMFLLWTAIVRESRSGKVMGPEERVSPMEGLRAVTINGAYQYFEEKTKGSIEKGKLADLVILSDDPLSINASKIKDIVVLETIKEGKTVFQKSK